MVYVGVDTGGTFTDVVAFDPDGGEIVTLKVPSIPDDPSRALLDGLVSAERARKLHRVTVDAENGVIDDDATAALRAV